MEGATKRLVSIPKAREVLGGIGNTTVYQLVKHGEIVKVNIGRRGFITSESLVAYIDRLSAVSTDCVANERRSTSSRASNSAVSVRPGL